MRKFSEFVSKRDDLFNEFEEFLAQQDLKLCEDWRGLLGGLARGVGAGAMRGLGALGGGAMQAAGGALGTAGSALQGQWNAAKQGMQSTLGGIGNMATSPLQAAMQGARSFQNRDTNAVASVIRTISNPQLKQTLQQAFDQWRATQQNPAAQANPAPAPGVATPAPASP